MIVIAITTAFMIVCSFIYIILTICFNTFKCFVDAINSLCNNDSTNDNNEEKEG